MDNFFHLYILLDLAPVEIQRQVRKTCIDAGIELANNDHLELNGVIELGAIDVEEAELSFYRITEEMGERLRPYKEYMKKSEVYLVTHRESLI